MVTPDFVGIDPRALHLPPSRLSGADPIKLHDQMIRFGTRMIGMPHLLGFRGSDGKIMVYDGVTRATRIAKLLPGMTVRVEIMRTLAHPISQLPTIGDTLP
jgi:hypothetical protein